MVFDVKNVFLHGELMDEVYMDIPPGYNTTQTGIFGRFTMAMKNNSFRQSNSYHILFLEASEREATNYLTTEFEMKNPGGLKYFLGIEVARSQEGIFLSQRKYVLDLLTDIGMLGCKHGDTPIVQNHHFGEYLDQVPTNKERYQRLVGRLIYLSHTRPDIAYAASVVIPTNKERYQRLVGRLIYLSHTRPDIAYAMSVVSQFMHSPSEDCMNAVIRILRYLKSAPKKGLMFSKHGHLNIDGYTDADWTGSITYRKSTSGYFTFMGEARNIRWLPYLVRKPSSERLLTELGYKPTYVMNLLCDKAAIAIAHNPIQHDRTKHVEVDRHYIKQKLEAKVIQFPLVKSEDQLADILTKAISSKAFHNSLDQLGIGDLYAPT
ncbi:hypothetical protein Prudu_017318 [Prunus dulcis]|uniref:Reverse transcriptase Ty1/copia-type domain-containing protein n=1 Tax=Prunus dulcis TaxID=3755 RepID=A0A4Y1RNJ3_PRUDU|nr:hypothetical protein Prudu_017318 [Prunus dulcis]